MAIIISYPTATDVTLSDKLLGTQFDGELGTSVTKNFSVSSIIGLMPNGAQGPQGIQGVQGIQGEEGLTGEQGLPGISGIQGTAGLNGEPGPVGPAGLNWQGAWVSETSYIIDDAVGYGGASWFCISPTSGIDSPDIDPTHWALLASQGAPGVQGIPGIQGLQGIQGIQGLQGFQGLQGLQGDQGIQGEPGPIGSLNGLSTTNQIFQVGTSGSNFNITSSGFTHTFNIPYASASNTGLITNAAQAIAGIKSFSSIPTAPTASPGTSNTQLATTAFVMANSGSSLTVGAFGTPTANGATISGGVLRLTPANAAWGGVVTIDAQQFSGPKTFLGLVYGPTAAPGTITTQLASTAFVGTAITNAALTMGGVTTNAGNGATITGNQLRLGVASALFPGIVNVDAQTFAGAKTFNSNIAANGISFGRGGQNTATCIGIGNNVMPLGTGINNIAIGNSSMTLTGIGSANLAIGNTTLAANLAGSSNVAIGHNSMPSATGSSNVAIGAASSGALAGGNQNTAIGASAGGVVSAGSGNVNIGYLCLASGSTVFNEITIGASVTGSGSNSVTLGNNSITKTILRGQVAIGTLIPTSKLQVVGLVDYANNAAASAAGLTVGAFYHTAGVVKVVI